jgi:hypothetical protein
LGICDRIPEFCKRLPNFAEREQSAQLWGQDIRSTKINGTFGLVSGIRLTPLLLMGLRAIDQAAQSTTI